MKGCTCPHAQSPAFAVTRRPWTVQQIVAGVISRRGRLRRRQQPEDPGAALRQAHPVQGLVVAHAIPPPAPRDFQPALAQAAQRLGVTLALGSLLLVIRVRPGTFLPALIGPQRHRGPQHLVARPSHVDEASPAALLRHRCRARVALPRFGRLEPCAVRADLAQQPRGQFLPLPGSELNRSRSG